MKESIFEGAVFGDKFRTRDGHMAIYGRCEEMSDGMRHILLVNDYEGEIREQNDYILPYDDGHIFKLPISDDVIISGKNKGKTVYESIGLNKEDMENYRLDIVSRWQEPIDEEELDNKAEDYFLKTYNQGIVNPELDIINEKEFVKADYKAGYRKALEK